LIVLESLNNSLGIIITMFEGILKFFGYFKASPPKEVANSETKKGPEQRQVHSIWDYISIKDNTQVFHLTNVIGQEEWIDMTEIRRRIKELYSMEYKNEKSLYPYLKTLVDLGLMENTLVGGKMRWRKKTALIVVEEEEKAEVVSAESGRN
jgi:hypothetical protein